MARTFQIKRGNVADIPNLAAGEPGFTLDGKKLYVGHPDGNVQISSDENYTTDEKNKLEGIEAGANKYTHPTTAGNKHIPSGGSTGQILRYSSAGTAKWDNETTIQVDDALSRTSKNPVQNKVVDEALGGKAPSQFVMTVTYDTEGGNNNTIDKTFAELEEAYQTGRQIRLVDTSGMEYELLAFAAGYMAYFSHQLLDERYILGFRANNTVTLDSVIPFTTNNPPNAIQVGAKGSNNASYTTGSIKTWAKNQQTSTSIGAHRNVTDLPETGSYWIVDLTISNSGMWRKLTATKCNTDGSAHTTYECTCMENTWSEWKKVGLNTEDWTFTLEDGSTVTKAVYVK